jgi:hypothetical protein
MTTYSVQVDGKTVWTKEADAYEGLDVFPREHFNRPADTPDGEPHPSPAVLLLDDVVIGVQRSHGDERDQLLAAAADESNPVAKAELERYAADAHANAQRALAAQED